MIAESRSCDTSPIDAARRVRENLLRTVVARPEVLECYLMTGDADYLLKVAVADLPALSEFISQTLSPHKSVAVDSSNKRPASQPCGVCGVSI